VRPVNLCCKSTRIIAEQRRVHILLFALTGRFSPKAAVAEFAEAIDRPWNPLALDPELHSSPWRLPTRANVNGSE